MFSPPKERQKSRAAPAQPLTEFDEINPDPWGSGLPGEESSLRSAPSPQSLFFSPAAPSRPSARAPINRSPRTSSLYLPASDSPGAGGDGGGGGGVGGRQPRFSKTDSLASLASDQESRPHEAETDSSDSEERPERRARAPSQVARMCQFLLDS